MRTTNELYHWGILGQKWGVRRYQNSDGTLTAEGIQRYRANSYNAMSDGNKRKYMRDKKKYNADINRANQRMNRRQDWIQKKTDEVKQASKLGTMSNIRNAAELSKYNKQVRDQRKFLDENEDQKQRFGRLTKRQRVGTVAGTAAAATGAAFVAGALAESAAVAALPAAAIAAGGAYVYHLTKR